MAQFVMARIEAFAHTIVHGGFIPLCGVPQAEIPVRTLAARVWAHYMFPTRDEAREAPEQIAQLRYDAQLDRNVAAMRLTDHQQTCPVCIWQNHNSVAKPN
jgi:hypothetical protein